MTNEIKEINRRSKRDILNVISDKYKTEEEEIKLNFNMGLFTFQEKTRQLCELTSKTIDLFKEHNIKEDDTYNR